MNGISPWVGKTIARRLVSMCQKEPESQIPQSATSPVQKHDATFVSKHRSQCVSNPIGSGILGNLPKNFRIFSSLLEKVMKMDDENG